MTVDNLLVVLAATFATATLIESFIGNKVITVIGKYFAMIKI
ncbi:hypothetical protein [Ligilactobacillus salivarius]|nr:hypothetical protein [Ligilactobacillus salivarius]